MTQADLNAGRITNTASETSTGPNGQALTPQSASSTATVTQSPALTVTKVADQQTYSSVGQTITYTITVANSGNVALTASPRTTRPSAPPT